MNFLSCFPITSLTSLLPNQEQLESLIVIMTPTYDAKSPKQAIDIKVKYAVFHIFPRLLGGEGTKGQLT